MADSSWDVLIIGGGPTGLAAGLHASWLGLRTVVLERALFGGQIANAERVENYPGIAEGISGNDLALQLREHGQKYGLRVVNAEVLEVDVTKDPRIITTENGAARAKTVIFAGGGDLRVLGIPGEEEYRGRGVSTCATCDGPFFQDKPVAVVGGGDTALDEAITLTNYASRVMVVHRHEELRAAQALQNKSRNQPKIAFLPNSAVEAVQGKLSVERLVVRNTVSGKTEDVLIAGVFVCIGSDPNTKYPIAGLTLDKAGHIPVNPWMETEIPGVFAAGEIRQHSIKHIAAVIGDGVTAAAGAARYLSEHS